MSKNPKWTREDLIEFLEVLIEHDVPIYNNSYFRKLLSRDQNLYMNQNVREATGKIAYKSVDGDIHEMSDEDFWELIDQTEYLDLIEDNAALAILKMAERFNLIN